MALLLLALRLTSWLGSLYFKAAENWAIYKAFFLASVMAIYSALVKKRAMVGCYFDWWDTDHLERKKIYPPIDLCLSLSLTQFEFVYPTNISVLLDLNLISNSKVLAKY